MSKLLPQNAQEILSKQNIEQKISRMAYEILELHYNTAEITILGIEGGGSKLAQLLTKEINKILDIPIVLGKIYVNKKEPYTEIPFVQDINQSSFNKNIIIVDDVGSSGSTLFHAIQSVYPLRPASLHVAVLIDRTHKKFPVKSNIIGMDLATTLTEHIDVVFGEDGTPEGAYIY